MQQKTFRSPVALVTGASRGIGRGIAEELAAAGWSLVINYCGNEKAAKESEASCRSRAVHAEQSFVTVQADISRAGDRERLAETAWNHRGGIDALVNNAGIAPALRADLLDASEESFNEIITTNLGGPYFLTQLVARRMLAQAAEHRRSIVFITSVSAETASVNRGDYCLSKAGLAMAAKLWAARLASDDIGVYEVRPGIMATDMTTAVKEKYDALIAEGLVPQKRWGTAADVGRSVRSLLQGDWAYSTGSVIHVDGGFHLSRL